MGIFIPFRQGGLILRLVAFVCIFVQPFADVVANYTSQNRDNKSSEYIFRKSTLPSVPVWEWQHVQYTIQIWEPQLIKKVLSAEVAGLNPVASTPWQGRQLSAG